MIPLRESIFAEYVDELSDSDLTNVWLLDKDEAADFWSMNFANGARGFHDLPSGSWVIDGPWVRIGSWMGAYEDGEKSDVLFALIRNPCDRRLNEQLMLVQSSKLVVSMTLDGFAHCWRELFTVFDDGPILVSEFDHCSFAALCFTPPGNLMKTVRRCSCSG